MHKLDLCFLSNKLQRAIMLHIFGRLFYSISRGDWIKSILKCMSSLKHFFPKVQFSTSFPKRGVWVEGRLLRLYRTSRNVKRLLIYSWMLIVHLCACMIRNEIEGFGEILVTAGTVSNCTSGIQKVENLCYFD